MAWEPLGPKAPCPCNQARPIPKVWRTMLSYRKANLNDVEALAKTRSGFLLEVGEFKDASEVHAIEAANSAYFQDALANESFIAWLALDDDKIVATSGLTFSSIPPTPRWPNGKAAHIMNIYTLPAYRKRGIAKELLTRIIEEANTRGCSKIELNATEAGKPLYQSCGFQDVQGDMVLYRDARYRQTADTASHER